MQHQSAIEIMEEAIKNKPVSGHFPWRVLWCGWLFVALLGMASTGVATGTALSFGLWSILLSLPAMLVLWHRMTARRLLALYQFQPERVLHRWGSRRFLSVVVLAVAALAWAAVVLLQSVFFSDLEWGLLALAPALYLLIGRLVQRCFSSQFRHAVHAGRWLAGLSGVLSVGLLWSLWMGVQLLTSGAAPVAIAVRVHELQSSWADAPSSLVKWSLDASAWGQASVESLGRQADSAAWRLALAALVAPVAVFGFVAASLQGMALSLTELRRTLGPGLSDAVLPAHVGPARAGVWSAMAVLGAMVLFQTLAAIEQYLKPHASPFALPAPVDCERIGGTVYNVGTLQAIQVLRADTEQGISSVKAGTCRQFDEITALASKGIDAYLDWYFSLGADLQRTAMMLTGNLDYLLESQFNKLVFQDQALSDALTRIQQGYMKQWEQAVAAYSQAADLMVRNRLVLSEQQCRVVTSAEVNPALVQFDMHRTRLTASATGGLVAGTFAAALTGKVMAKTTMKSASKVLVKVAGKKLVTKAGAAAAGAAIGTVVAPGLGTAVGGVIGAVVGTVLGVGIDMVALSAEEHFNRDQMKQDLLEAVTEQVTEAAKFVGCR